VTQPTKSAPRAAGPAIHFAAQQDLVGEAQFMRPVIVRALGRGHSLMTWGLVICTVVVAVVVVLAQLADTRGWASMPDGTTYEVIVHEDEQAAASYELRKHPDAAAQAAPAQPTVPVTPGGN
jgi:hypothetical protein